MGLQLETLFKQGLNHECECVRCRNTECGRAKGNCTFRGLGFDIPAFAVQPVGAAYELLVVAVRKLNYTAQRCVRSDEPPSRLISDTGITSVEAPAWTTIVVTGPKDEVLYQTPLRKTLLVSRGVEFDGPTVRDFKLVVPPSERTHEARLRFRGGSPRSILQAKQQ
jgi:hypothetical protein